ncbi:hypothetical protein WMY93_025294 [Mugilogobius chulae]|uniref:Uncharacterized protein n=1 Tax=Mugilogobius chulae TaxID=88201 RepID=A0AAW0N6G0_9GOBI
MSPYFVLGKNLQSLTLCPFALRSLTRSGTGSLVSKSSPPHRRWAGRRRSSLIEPDRSVLLLQLYQQDSQICEPKGDCMSELSITAPSKQPHMTVAPVHTKTGSKQICTEPTSVSTQPATPAGQDGLRAGPP